MILRRLFWLTSLVIVGLFACSRYAIPEMSNEQHLRRYLDAKESIYEDICVQMGEEYWKYYAREAEADLSTPRQRFREFLTDDMLNRIVDSWYSMKPTMRDSMLMSRVATWHNILTAAKVEMDAEVFELRNQLESWLAVTDNAHSIPTREEMDSVMLKLMQFRNAKARSLGFGNFAELVLEVTDIGADWFYKFVETVEVATAEPYARLLDKIRREKGVSEIGSREIRNLWGLYYVTSQGAQIDEKDMNALMKQTIENIGIEYDDLNVEITEQDLPGGVAGQSLAIRIPDDFKVVVTDDLSFYDRVHEIGHGAQYTFTTVPYPVLKGYEWCLGCDCGAYSEGIAETMARFVCNDEWQKKYAGMDASALATQKEILNEYFPLYLRFMLMQVMYEIELYRDLSRDPKHVWQAVQEKYLTLGNSTLKPVPFANILFVSYPIYVQSYLIGDVISWQIHETLEDRFGPGYAFESRVGAFLKEHFYADGELYPWQMRLRKATGRELDVDGYLSAAGLKVAE